MSGRLQAPCPRPRVDTGARPPLRNALAAAPDFQHRHLQGEGGVLRDGFDLAAVPVHADAAPSHLPPPMLVSRPGDSAERAADEAAERVLRGERISVAPVAQPVIARKCSACEEEDREPAPVRRKARCDSSVAGPAPPAVAAALAAPGRPLDPAVRAAFEPRFGASFADVRIHSDRAADTAARAVDAAAFTVGRRIAFAAGRYAPDTPAGQRLLAHELAHAVQNGTRPGAVLRRRSAGEPSPTAPAGPAPAPPAPGGRAQPVSVDILSARDPEDFLVRAAAQTLGADYRVSSLNDMINQLAAATGAKSCVARLRVYNHANPSHQAVAGGSKVKSAAGTATQSPTEGFSLTWLLNDSNQSQLNRLRGTLCCNSEMNWYGCSTAGVWAEGGERTAAERTGNYRFEGTYANFYHSVEDALAHGATQFRQVGAQNIQSWSNALCSQITASTDFNNWRTVGGTVTRTVLHGGQDLRYSPQSDSNCSCDAATGRLTGPAPTGAQLRSRSDHLREHYLTPVRERATALLGTAQPARPDETAAERSAREGIEAAEAQAAASARSRMEAAVLANAGFAAGTRPQNADEALRIAAAWQLDLATILGNLPAQAAATAQQDVGSTTGDSLAQDQRDAIAALPAASRETFLAALLIVQRESYWRNYLAGNTIYIIPDIERRTYGGFTQTATRRDRFGRTERVHAVHMSRPLMALGDVPRVAATIVHELSHHLQASVASPALRPLILSVAELIASHPRIAALRAGAADPAAAERQHVRSINQMLYERSTRAEDEIFVHLQQLTHQPSMFVGGRWVSGSTYILGELIDFIRQVGRIGLPPREQTALLQGVFARAMRLFDDRIAAAPAGSPEQRRLRLDKELAMATWQLARQEASRPPPSA